MTLGWRKRRQAKAEQERAAEVEADEVRFQRTLLREEVTTFGEQLAQLHIDTLGTPLVDDLASDYQAALDVYENTKGPCATSPADPRRSRSNRSWRRVASASPVS